MYDAGVDAVVICTEDYLRTRYAMEALEPRAARPAAQAVCLHR